MHFEMLLAGFKRILVSFLIGRFPFIFRIITSIANKISLTTLSVSFFCRPVLGW